MVSLSCTFGRECSGEVGEAVLVTDRLQNDLQYSGGAIQYRKLFIVGAEETWRVEKICEAELEKPEEWAMSRASQIQ